MQFVKKGPDVPDALLQAHAEGRVVFFTGAGISRPAGLSDFRGLVDDIYADLHEARKGPEVTAFEEGRYDTVLDLLERRIHEGRINVRRALARALKPKKGRRGRENQLALLKLSRHDDGLRLVTTNFDRLFENARRDAGVSFNSFQAPLLPVPKRTRWSGLTYLHGLLPKRVSDTELEHLVVSSGDFGRAYLTEGWAARFASELFRDFTVCFVGYSMGDPVLRYMMDALAADRESGETRPEAFAFASFKPGKEKDVVHEWRAKGVIPVPYQEESEARGHERLTQTLVAWADLHGDGVRMCESFVEDSAPANPEASSSENDFVGRVIWAVSHASGLPARKFAQMEPAPAFEWLQAFSKPILDANGRRVEEEAVEAADRFSLLDRPSEDRRAATMHLARWGDVEPIWDNVLRELARWVVRYLGKPELLLWIVQQGGRLHSTFREAVEWRFAELGGLDAAGEQRERQRSPHGFPSPPLLWAWRLLLNGRIKEVDRDHAWHRWTRSVEREGVSASLLLQMRELLAPKIRLRKQIRLDELEGGDEPEPSSLWDLFDWELVLASDVPTMSLREFVKSSAWDGKALVLLELFTELLLDGLRIMEEVEAAGPEIDLSWFHHPSIEHHFQNRGFRGWVVLLEVLRDAWIALSKEDLGAARGAALRWYALPFPAFKRLALFAAGQGGDIEPGEWLEWLLADDCRWLWNSCVRREVLRLIARQGKALGPEERQRLERAILAGAERDAKKTEESVLDVRGVWVRLAKLRDSGASLGVDARQVLEGLEKANTWLRVAPQKREEFLSWMHGTGDPDFESQRRIDVAPRSRAELVDWLCRRAVPDEDWIEETTWPAVCVEEPRLALHALSDCAKLDVWPTGEWGEALYAWLDQRVRWLAWRRLAHSILAMPPGARGKTESAVAFFVRRLADEVGAFQDTRNRRDAFVAVCLRLIAESESSGQMVGDFVGRAINHPLGRGIEALTNLWLQERAEGQDLPEDAWKLLSRVCHGTDAKYQNGRVILASRIASLYRVNSPWCVEHLVPRFSWEESEVEAAAAWGGFLWAPQIVPGLIEELGDSLLGAARHYEALEGHHPNYCAVLVHLATRMRDVFTPERVKEALVSMPDEGRLECVQALARTLDAKNDDERGERWEALVRPFWQDVWPKDAQPSSKLAQVLARVAIKSGSRFPQALEELRPWLQATPDAFFVAHQLHESELITKFPQAALELLDVAVDGTTYLGKDVKACLDEIEAVDKHLRDDPRFRKLKVEVRKQGD